jgi:hypothetical protein
MLPEPVVVSAKDVVERFFGAIRGHTQVDQKTPRHRTPINLVGFPELLRKNGLK